MTWSSIEALLQVLGRGLYDTPLTVSVRVSLIKLLQMHLEVAQEIDATHRIALFRHRRLYPVCAKET
jgi:hypothetical protein